MPNNKQAARHRAQYLLKRFQKDQSFFNEYKEFMCNVSAEAHSEEHEEEQDQLEHEEGKVWSRRRCMSSTIVPQLLLEPH